MILLLLLNVYCSPGNFLLAQNSNLQISWWYAKWKNWCIL